MATKIRKQIYLEPEQDRLLKRLSDRSGLSEAEIIRRAIDVGISSRTGSRSRPEIWKSEIAYIRRLMRKGSVRGGRTWRRKDLHER